MTPEEIKMECLRLACNNGHMARLDPKDVVSVADAYFGFITGATKESPKIVAKKKRK